MRVDLKGVRFDSLTENALIAEIMRDLEAGKGGHLVTPNVSIVRLAQEASTRALVNSATLVACDGMPLVWAARLRGTPLPERITGSSLIWSLSAAAARHGRSIFLLGGQPGAPDAAARHLGEFAPGLRIAGTLCPRFGFEHDAIQLAAVLDAVVQSHADIIYVGLGFPKQEELIRRLREELPQAWFVGCGAAINFAGLLQRRAPRWMQQSGLEWLHRLASEPRRLSGRYAADLLFTVRLLTGAALDRLNGSDKTGQCRDTSPRPVLDNVGRRRPDSGARRHVSYD